MDFGRAGIYIRILIPALMLYALGSLFINAGRLESAQQAHMQTQETLRALEEQNRTLAEEIARAEDPQFLEQLARQRLGLVMPEDKIFYDLGK